MDRENPQLEDVIRALHQQMEDNPTSEKPLEELIKVEEALRTRLEVKELSKETKAEIDRVLIGLTGRTISAFLDEIHERAFRVMKCDSVEAKDDIEGYLAKLKIVYRKVERVILTPDERNGIVAGSGKGIEKKELHTNKLQHLLELLRANEIYTDDICIVIGKNTPNMMREGSYLCIEIPKIKRTILLHLGYGEASFVLYDIYDRAKVFEMTKEGIQEKLRAAKVQYTERDLNKWGSEMLNALKLNEAVQQPKVNIENYDRRAFYIEAIKEVFSTPEKFMALYTKQKLSLKIHGRGLTNLTTIIIGDSGLKPIARSTEMAILARAIYGEGHEIIECEFWNKERWIEKIKKQIPTADTFMALSYREIMNMRFLGKGITNLATIIIGKAGMSPKGDIKNRAILARVIYGEGHEVIECEFWNKERWIEEIKKHFPTPEEYMALIYKQKIAFKIHGKGLNPISTIITGKCRLDPCWSVPDSAVFARAVYGSGHIVIERELWNKNEWIEEIKKHYPSPEIFMSLSYDQKSAFRIRGKGLSFLSTIIGDKDRNPIGSNKDFALLAKEIYGEGYKIIDEALKEDVTANWDKNKWIFEIMKIYPTADSFMEVDRKKILIYGKGLRAIGTIITGETGLIINLNIRDFAIIAKSIYGEGHNIIEDTLKEYETYKWDVERWKEEIKKQFPIPEDFMAVTYEQKKVFKLKNKGLKHLATKIIGQSGLRPKDQIKDYAILAQTIYGDGHEIIECEFWDKERWIEEIKKQLPTVEEFMGLVFKQKKELKIHGKSLKTLVTKITEQTGLDPIGRTKDMAILAEAIYGDQEKPSEE